MSHVTSCCSLLLPPCSPSRPPAPAFPPGLPIRPAFSQRLPGRRALKRSLGLDPDLPAILLVGGGEGMGKLEATVDKIAAKLGHRAQARGQGGGGRLGFV